MVAIGLVAVKPQRNRNAKLTHTTTGSKPPAQARDNACNPCSHCGLQTDIRSSIMSDCRDIPGDRELTLEKSTLIQWMLENGSDCRIEFVPQLAKARVVSRCSCGCASINFAIDGKVAPAGNVHALDDFYYSQNENPCCAFVFERGGLLAGLEVYSLDGKCTPFDLPAASSLRWY